MLIILLCIVGCFFTAALFHTKTRAEAWRTRLWLGCIALVGIALYALLARCIELRRPSAADGRSGIYAR